MAPSQFTVAILPLGDISTKQIEFTKLILEHAFGVSTIILPAKEVPSQYFNADRGRYQAFQLLKFLFFQLPTKAQRIVGIIDGELECDINETCFGYASCDQRAALYSVPSIFKQLPEQSANELLDQKDAQSYHLVVHELGHTLGIEHCAQLDCAMNTVRPGLEMCPSCRRWANYELKVQPGSAEERFSLAESFLQNDCPTEAVAMYREAIRLAPREPLYHHRLYFLLHRLNQFEEGKQSLELAIKYSDDYQYYYICGLTLLQSILKKTEEYFNIALATNKDPRNMQKLIGQAYRVILHDVELASRHYKEYLKLGGNDQDIIDWLISRSQLDPA